MRSSLNVREIIVVPRNGLANRLQAWASAAIFAAECDVPVKVVWESEDVMPALPSDLFAPSVTSRWFADPDIVISLAGLPHSELPRYVSQVGDALVLAGHDKGEQGFISDIVARLSASPRPLSLIIIAGGNFHLTDASTTTRQRGIFYRELAWSAAVNERVMTTPTPHQPYVALHIRETDRSVEAPSSRSIRSALQKIRRDHPERSLFIAADTQQGQSRWAANAGELGFDPWSLPGLDRERTRTAGAIDAAADWRLLGGARAIVYPGASTFSREASVASGNHEFAIPVTAGATRQRGRRMGAFVQSAATYPSRHRFSSAQTRAADNH